jgi:DNA invertase Pin-like site-specific DNA recombinase
MNGQKIGYVRVSSITQNTGRQLDGMDLDEVFEDKVSGKDVNRPQLEAMLKHVRKGDTVYVHSMDRLARNLDDLRRIVKELTGRGVKIQFVKESLTFTDERNSMAELLLNVMGAFAEFERSLILERQREGIAIAKAKGAFKGRKRVVTDAQIAMINDRVANGEKKAVIARDLGISRETLYQYLNKAAN